MCIFVMEQNICITQNYKQKAVHILLYDMNY